jgi:hypothetical protein
MPASKILTWDIASGDGGARRPTLNDVGGATLIDDDKYPPDPASMPYADQLNEIQRQIAALAKVAPAALISVHIASGTPTIVAATGPGSAVVPGLFTVTDLGTGHTQISWPAGSLPPPSGILPLATCNQSAGVQISAVQATNSVTVLTNNDATTPADCDFTVAVY